MKKTILYLSVCALWLTVSAQSTLIRYPYLNHGSSSGIVIKWRTSQSELGEVKYGINHTSLSFSIAEDSAVTDHEVFISSLQPNTTYYYSVGSSGSFYTPNDGTYYFKTSPPHGTAQPMRLWVIGDFGNGSQATIDVKNSFLNNYRDVHTDAWLWTGDNAYADGTDQEYQANVFDVYPEVFKNTTVWPCPGNHDYRSIDANGNGPYYNIFTLPKNGECGGVASGEEAYYSFDYGNAHFISINSEILYAIVFNNTTFAEWLKKDLQDTKQDWVIAYWHQPPYSKGRHDSDENFSNMQFMRENINPILEQYGCDLVLNGHSHGYERSYLINGHYGISGTFDPATMLINGTNGNMDKGNTYMKYTQGANANKGTVYAIVGCSGKKEDPGDSPLNHPAMYMSTENFYGSMVIDINGLVLNSKFVDVSGAVLDQFTIKKENSTGTGDINYTSGIRLNAYPNPFENSFFVEFELEKQEMITIEVKDVQGKTIETLCENYFSEGKHKLVYEPKQTVSEGIFIIEIKTPQKLEAKRLVRIKP